MGDEGEELAELVELRSAQPDMMDTCSLPGPQPGAFGETGGRGRSSVKV